MFEKHRCARCSLRRRAADPPGDDVVAAALLEVAAVGGGVEPGVRHRDTRPGLTGLTHLVRRRQFGRIDRNP